MTGAASTYPGFGRASAPSRVVIIDDSLTMRSVLTRIVASEDNLAIVGKFGSAELALIALESLSPEIILLDLELPGMSGLEALPRILATCPAARVLVISSLTAKGAEATVQALATGAADTMPKPDHAAQISCGQSPSMRFEADLVAKLRGLSKCFPHRLSRHTLDVARDVPPPARKPTQFASGAPDIIAIGASTGGIHALIQLLQALPQTVVAPILVTQHLPGAFMQVFAGQLASAAGRPAIVAERGMVLQPLHIYVAPGDGHLIVERTTGGLTADIRTGAVPSGCTPSVDAMLSSLASTVNGRVIGVILSGMGRDGADGARDLVEAGGMILAQDRESSAVWGMPRAVVEAGLTDCCAPPRQLALRIAALVRLSPKPERREVISARLTGAVP